MTINSAAQGLLDGWNLGNVLAADCPSRVILQHLTNPQPATTTDDLRPRRHELGASLATVAAALDTRPARISELERGRRRPPELEQRYRDWLIQQAA